MLEILIGKLTISLLLALSFVTTHVIHAQRQTAYQPSAQAVGRNEADADDRIRSSAFLRTELYFGMNKPGGRVTKEQFAAFLSDVVTPKFPDGLTVLDGIGQFRNSKNRIVREKCKVLILLYPTDRQKESGDEIELIREAYKTRFQQESVLRVDAAQAVQISF